MATTSDPRHGRGIPNARPEDQQCPPQDAEHRQQGQAPDRDGVSPEGRKNRGSEGEDRPQPRA